MKLLRTATEARWAIIKLRFLEDARWRAKEKLGEANADPFYPGQDLAWADFDGVTIEGRDLTGANLTGANLTGTKFIGCNLTGADFTWALTEGTEIRFCNITDVIGLDPY